MLSNLVVTEKLCVYDVCGDATPCVFAKTPIISSDSQNVMSVYVFQFSVELSASLRVRG